MPEDQDKVLADGAGGLQPGADGGRSGALALVSGPDRARSESECRLTVDVAVVVGVPDLAGVGVAMAAGASRAVRGSGRAGSGRR
ncbi:MAG TPA: hypothetical protein VFD59_16290 [Nocardioidaceae bacterium]|nr:hypothetical protein [Nocardioidaceae bacterium]